MDNEIKIASHCATAVWEQLMKEPNFNTSIYDIGANDISDIILNLLINLLKDKKMNKKMNFGGAIEALKQGKKVAREGWNGKGMLLYYVSEGRYPVKMEVAKEIADEEGMVNYGAYIAMKTAQGNVVPWLASQTDVLGEDWVIVEPQIKEA